MREPDELTERFRQTGRKITPQRQAIFRALYDAVDHPTAEAVYARVSAEQPSISLRTVYQTLNDLVAMGEITSLDLGTGSTRFDPTAADHHHLVCTGCGTVHDLFVEGAGVDVPTEQRHGFVVGRPEITWRGLCPDCQANTKQPAQPERQVHA